MFRVLSFKNPSLCVSFVKGAGNDSAFFFVLRRPTAPPPVARHGKGGGGGSFVEHNKRRERERDDTLIFGTHFFKNWISLLKREHETSRWCALSITCVSPLLPRRRLRPRRNDAHHRNARETIMMREREREQSAFTFYPWSKRKNDKLMRRWKVSRLNANTRDDGTKIRVKCVTSPKRAGVANDATRYKARFWKTTTKKRGT